MIVIILNPLKLSINAMNLPYNYITLTLLFIANTTLHTLLGFPIPALLGATTLLLLRSDKTANLKIYAISLVCLESFLWFGHLMAPLLYLSPLYYGAPRLKQLLMPATTQLLPYALFTMAFTAQYLVVEPVTTAVFPAFYCTFWPFCATIIVMKIGLKYVSQRQFR